MKQKLFTFFFALVAMCMFSPQKTWATEPTNVQAVDLGLPSGTLWANMNVGATSETEEGYHIAWGEADKRTEYTTGNRDIVGVMAYDNDAAMYYWSQDWCIPTASQWKELIDEENTEWTSTDGGYKIQSKHNDNYIILPAVGLQDGTAITENGTCNYWSRTCKVMSTWNTAQTIAYALTCSNNPTISEVLAYKGLSIRPVKVKRAYEATIDVQQAQDNSIVDYQLLIDAVQLYATGDLLWAKRNVGAFAEEDFGYYYAWGETKPQAKKSASGTYTWSSKYKNSSNLLNEDYDAAHAYLGDGWRLPTDAEMTALMNTSNCNKNTSANQNGVDGYIITGKTSPYTSNTIFIPKAGIIHTSGAYINGSSVLYWTSKFKTGSSSSTVQSYRLSTTSATGASNCYYRYVIRPVYPKSELYTLTVKTKVGDDVTNTYTYLCSKNEKVRIFPHAGDGARFNYWSDDNSTESPHVVTVSSTNMEITANFRTVTEYTITFKDGDGESIQSTKVEQGVNPKYTGETPTKKETDVYDYEWTGWKDGSDKEYGKTETLPAVTESATYTATFNAITTPKHKVTFLSETGGELYTVTLKEGRTPEFVGTIPTKDGYLFDRWTPDIEPLGSGDAVYRVKYRKEPDYFTLTNTGTSDAKLYLKRQSGDNTNTINMAYSINGSEWKEHNYGNANNTPKELEINIPAGQSIRFRGSNPRAVGYGLSTTTNIYWYLYSTESKFTASGDIMSMVAFDENTTTIIADAQVSQYGFNSLFGGTNGKFTTMTDASQLKMPSNLSQYCFSNMFYGCTSLVTPPALPATALQPYCYNAMFSGCKALTSAPALPAMTLATGCYYLMFNGCVELVDAPTLPATILQEGCYAYMFQNCSTLVNVQDTLPGTNLPDNCYQYMFNGCVALESAPEIMAASNAIVGNKCMYYMFANCSKLTKAPSVLRPATLSGKSCVSFMFSNCTTLQKAPYIMATSISESNAADKMFENCSNLNYMRIGRTSWGNSNYWIKNVSMTGTIYCPPTLPREYDDTHYNQMPYNSTNPWTIFSYDVTFVPVGGSWADGTTANKRFTWETDTTDIHQFIAAQVDAGSNNIVEGFYLSYENETLSNQTTEVAIKNDLHVQQSANTKYIYVKLKSAASIVMIVSNNSEYGSVDETQLTGVEHGTTISADGNELTIGTTTVTATPKEADAQYTYTFTGWTGTAATVTDNMTITANFTRTTNKYDIIFKDDDNTTVLKSENLEYGATITAPVVADKEDALNTYTFKAWSPAFTSETTVTAAATYTATYTATPKAYFELEDDKYEDDDFYSTLASLVDQKKNVKYMRTFPAGTPDVPSWSAFSLPFDYPIEDDPRFNQSVLSLDYATYDDVTGTLTLYFLYQDTYLSANKPYIFYNKGAVLENPIFNGVKIVEPAKVTDEYADCAPQGKVYFKNTIAKIDLPNNQNIAFLYDNKLYYSGSGNTMRAFRGYFEMVGVVDAGSAAPRRIVMMVDETTALTSEMEVTSINTKKVIEGGVLYIERNGVRYDAQGATVK